MAHILGFYHEDGENGWGSNWYPAAFTYGGVDYVSTEQYLMYHKVMLFGQEDLGRQILAASDPMTAKTLGRTPFAAFRPDLWDRHCGAVLRRGLRAKFLQHPHLRRALLDTGEALLAECAPRDTKWGIGLGLEDPAWQDVSRWRGENLLGRLLMQVRAELARGEARGLCRFRDVRREDFPLWQWRAGELLRHPRYHASVQAYAAFLPPARQRDFLYRRTLAAWEKARGEGDLPAVGFYELKQDLFELARFG